MDTRILRRIAARLILAGGGLLPGVALADSGLFAAPSIAVEEVHDDNLFAAPSQPQADRFLRVSPAIEAGYRSVPMSLRGLYTFDAERYTRHPELDTNRAREHSALDFRYEPTSSLTLLADAGYIKTLTPGELTPETGLQFGRARAESLTFSPSLVYRFNHVDTGTATYRFTRNKLAGEVGSDTHTAVFDIDRRLAERDTASFRYRYDQFRFDTGDTVNAHTLLGGGTHELTPQTAVTVLGGPRFSEGSVDPEVSATLSHKLERGELGLAYTRSQTAVLGVVGPVDTEALSATLSYSIGSSIELRAVPAYLSSKHNGLRARVSAMDLEAGYRIARFLTLIGSYQFSSQRGSIDAPGFGDISRNVVLLGLVVAAPERAGSESRPRVLMPSTLFEGSPVISGESLQEEEE